MSFMLVSRIAWNGALYDLKYDIETTVDELVDLVPKRSTSRSAGYDFFMPFDLDVEPGKEYIVPTGFKWNPSNSYIKAQVDFPESEDKNKKGIPSKNPFENTIYVPTIYLRIASPVLVLQPRSSLGFKYGFRLLNTMGIIDADYFNNIQNEGQIMVGFTVDKPLTIKRGDKFCQGIILSYVFDGADKDDVKSSRQGGIGSTK